MFSILDPPHEPLVSDEQRAAVVHAGRMRRRSRRIAVIACVTTVLLGAATALAVREPSRPLSVAVIGPDGRTQSSDTTVTSEVQPSTTTTVLLQSTTTTSPPATTTTAPQLARVEPKATRDGMPAVSPRPGIRLSLRLDQEAVRVGERFDAILVIENGSSEDLIYHGHPCVAFHQGIYERGRWVGGQRNRNCTAVVPPPVVVPPGGTKEVHREFDTLSHDDSPLPPQLYQVGAGIYQRDADNREVAWFAPAVDIEIRAAS